VGTDVAVSRALRLEDHEKPERLNGGSNTMLAFPGQRTPVQSGTLRVLDSNVWEPKTNVAALNTSEARNEQRNALLRMRGSANLVSLRGTA